MLYDDDDEAAMCSIRKHLNDVDEKKENEIVFLIQKKEKKSTHVYTRCFKRERKSRIYNNYYY